MRFGIFDLETGEILNEGDEKLLDTLSNILERIENLEKNLE